MIPTKLNKNNDNGNPELSVIPSKFLQNKILTPLSPVIGMPADYNIFLPFQYKEQLYSTVNPLPNFRNSLYINQYNNQDGINDFDETIQIENPIFSQQNRVFSSPYYMNPLGKTISKISRILILKCSNIDLLTQLLASHFHPSNLVYETFFNVNKQNFVAIGLYDLRDVKRYTAFLKELTFSNQLWNTELNYIEDEYIKDVVLLSKNFKFLENIYDTLYLLFEYQNIIDINCIDFQKLQNEVYIQLLNFGALYQISHFPNKICCFRCRFYNVKVPLQLKKLQFLRVANSKAIICHTIIDVHKTSNAISHNHQSLIKCEISEAEWRKYQFLKHRRLGSLFSVNKKIPTENQIKIEDILSGRDNRVTLMIRNIPNKIKHENLKKFIDVTSFGDYNFLCMYYLLRHIFLENNIGIKY